MNLPGTSIFNLFTIGIGPSSSHTVGPMKAARDYVLSLRESGRLNKVTSLRVDLYGSLALTGKGHGADRALIAGLAGCSPNLVSADEMAALCLNVEKKQRLRLLDIHEIPFDQIRDIVFNYSQTLPAHSNGMKFSVIDPDLTVRWPQVFYSVGGGVVVSAEDAEGGTTLRSAGDVKHDFNSAQELLEICAKLDLSIHQLVLENEKQWQTEQQVNERLLEMWQVMQDCVKRGCSTDGMLPGGLNVQRRAPKLYRDLTTNPERALRDPLSVIDWVNLYALAVNEENAAGGRVVTAPTNGAAGIIPAALHYYDRFCYNSNEAGVIRFLLTAGAIGLLYKKNASISGAEVGCQGEVGVACSMAAGGLVAALGGDNRLIETAAEIGMEHNLGLTCDPVGGLVQIPCIERNAMGAVKAINAARIARQGDGTHKVSLDQVINTMQQTGKDMQERYKETSKGGLAVNVVEC